MKMSKIAAALISTVIAPLAMAVPITGLVNTGAGVADNAQDTNYALTVTNGNTVAGTYGFAADQVGWPDASPWIGSNGTSKWLTPFQNRSPDPRPGSKRRLCLDPDLRPERLRHLGRLHPGPLGRSTTSARSG